jgi:hypothetical protein
VRAALAALVLAAACGKSSPRPIDAAVADPRKPPSAADLDALDHGLEKDVIELAALPCERPMLRGEPRAGTGDDDLAALVSTPGPELTACVDAWKAVDEQLRSRLRQCDVDLTASGHCTPRAPSAADAAGIAQAIDGCAGVVADRFNAAAQHTASCSPLRATVPPSSGDRIRLIHAAHIAEQHALALAAQGKALDGARVLLDVMMVASDLIRGGTPWVDAVLGVAIWLREADVVAAIARAPELTADELDQLGAEVDRLIAGLPPVQSIIRGDAVAVVSQVARPVLRADGGGAAVEGQPKTPAEAAFMWRATNAVRDMVLATCSDGTPLVRCMTLLDDEVKAGKLNVDPVIVAAMTAIPSNVKFIRKYATAVAGLHALRAELAIGAVVKRSKACPTQGEPDLGSGGLGAPLALVADAASPGEWRIETAGALGSFQRSEPYVVARFVCKDGALAPAPMPAPAR